MTILPFRQPRDLSHILSDLHQAKRTWNIVFDDLDQKSMDRADERLTALREEFDARLQEATGISVREIQSAFEGALL